MADINILKRELAVIGAGQRTFRQLKGIGNFVTTAANGTLVVAGFKTIHSVVLTPLTLPATQTEMIQQHLGSLADSGSMGSTIRCPHIGTVTEVAFTTKDVTAAHNDNHWTFRLTNKGAAGSGTGAVIAATSANSTDANASPVGFSLAAYVPKAMTLGADVAVAAGDLLEFTATEAGTGPTMTECSLAITIDIGGTDESLYCSSTVSSAGTITMSNNRITIARTGNIKTSALKFAFVITGR